MDYNLTLHTFCLFNIFQPDYNTNILGLRSTWWGAGCWWCQSMKYEYNDGNKESIWPFISEYLGYKFKKVGHLFKNADSLWYYM